LAGLLADYAKPDRLEAEALDRPLTLLLDEALHTAGRERFERLRSLGDGVLYTSGFFADHLSTRGVELRYVRALGARAYDSAAAMLRQSAGDGSGARCSRRSCHASRTCSKQTRRTTPIARWCGSMSAG